MSTKEQKERKKAYNRQWNRDHKAAMKRAYKRWAKTHKKQISDRFKRFTNKNRFGGNRLKVLKRDNYQCVECSMTRYQHYKRWNRDLTVHHIDGEGRYSTNPNNKMSNLETLCLSCHGRKDLELARALGKHK